MRVVQISGAYMGAQKTIERAIHNEWLSRGHDSMVLYAIGEADEAGISCYESRFAMLVRRALRKVLGKNPHFSYLSTRQLIRCLRKIQPDLVHLHVLHNGYTDYDKLFRYLSAEKIPVVYTVHDMWAFTGGCYYYTEERCSRFETGCRQCPAAKQRLDNPPRKTAAYYRRKRRLFSSLDKIQFIAVSRWVAEEMQKSFLADYPVTVINNGIDPPRIGTAYQPDGDRFTLLSVAATWDERKGIYRIFEMARLLGEAYRFELVGYVSAHLRKSAPDNVRFLDYIGEKEELLRLYDRADLYVSASLEETFGMTFVEAAFMGTRSVGFASTAVADTLHGVCGVAVEQLTVQAMADAIRRTVRREDLKLTKEETEQIAARYSSKAMAQAYCDRCLAFLEGEI